MNLRTKLIISLGTITLIILALSVTVIHTLDRQHISMRELIDYNFSKVALTEELKNETNVISREVRELLLTTSESVQNEKEATIYEAMQNISEIFHSLEQISLEEDEKQLILNIGLNGLEAMSPGGILEIKTFVQDEFAVLEIKATGPGIKKEVLANIELLFLLRKRKGQAWV